MGVTVKEDYGWGEFSDGSKKGGHTAAATTKKAFYLGEVATVMDAGIAMGWEQSKKVATDSQGVNGRIRELRFERARSWIEEVVIAVQKGNAKEIAWVKTRRHSRKRICGFQIERVREHWTLAKPAPNSDPSRNQSLGVSQDMAQERDKRAHVRHSGQRSSKELALQDRESREVHMRSKRTEWGAYDEVRNSRGRKRQNSRSNLEKHGMVYGSVGILTEFLREE